MGAVDATAGVSAEVWFLCMVNLAVVVGWRGVSALDGGKAMIRKRSEAGIAANAPPSHSAARATLDIPVNKHKGYSPVRLSAVCYSFAQFQTSCWQTDSLPAMFRFTHCSAAMPIAGIQPLALANSDL